MIMSQSDLPTKVNGTGPAIEVLSNNNLKFKLLSKITFGGVHINDDELTIVADTFGTPSNSQKNESETDLFFVVVVSFGTTEARAANGSMEGLTSIVSVSLPNNVA